ncbi:hypothetical protein PHYPSEUDO_006751 [Phytophthora pseudosyringae]|uniref:Uncharacterized protein n=1 Tax=Phytophthora pseudosyringae TaxID=221518 RepID=A0A8T1VKT9_9STRA|nr:hypothetical protein PHYPSEUDO_006751 [Phytophthora pseudosyringae]
MEQLRRGSTNSIFFLDCSAGALLPQTSPQTETYEDLLAAISGLASLGDALFYDHVRRLMSQIKRFVLANMERECNTPERVTLTPLYVNNLLGRAMTHFVEDSPDWWRNYYEVVRAVDYHAANWQASLNGLAFRIATSSSATTSTTRAAPRIAPAASRRVTSASAGRVPHFYAATPGPPCGSLSVSAGFVTP